MILHKPGCAGEVMRIRVVPKIPAYGQRFASLFHFSYNGYPFDTGNVGGLRSDFDRRMRTSQPFRFREIFILVVVVAYARAAKRLPAPLSISIFVSLSIEY
jgi:hypothetical protein